MLNDDAIARLSAGLITLAGGYLRNPIRLDGVTCIECTTPVDRYLYCYQCNDRRAQAGLADSTAMLTYAVAGQQSGYVLRGYKAARPLEEHSAIVALLVLLSPDDGK